MLKILVILLAVTALSGCALVRSPVMGGIYTETQSGLTATSNPAGNRVGKACATSILGLVATGDATIEAARRAGGITAITSVDEESSSIVGVYGKYCTVVRGR